MNESEDPHKGMLREKIAEYGAALPATDDALYTRGSSEAPELDATIRTQIYLPKKHHDFLKSKSKQSGQSMAAIIRELINEKMNPEHTAWEDNPLLETVAIDPNFESSGEGSVSADSSVYGAYEQ